MFSSCFMLLNRHWEPVTDQIIIFLKWAISVNKVFLLSNAILHDAVLQHNNVWVNKNGNKQKPELFFVCELLFNFFRACSLMSRSFKMSSNCKTSLKIHMQIINGKWPQDNPVLDYSFITLLNPLMPGGNKKVTHT